MGLWRAIPCPCSHRRCATPLSQIFPDEVCRMRGSPRRRRRAVLEKPDPASARRSAVRHAYPAIRAAVLYRLAALARQCGVISDARPAYLTFRTDAKMRRQCQVRAGCPSASALSVQARDHAAVSVDWRGAILAAAAHLGAVLRGRAATRLSGRRDPATSDQKQCPST